MTESDPTEEPRLEYQVMADLNREPLTPIQLGVVIITLISGLSISASCVLIALVLGNAPTLSDSILYATVISVLGAFFLGTYLMYHRFVVHRLYMVAFYTLFGFEVLGVMSIVQAWK